MHRTAPPELLPDLWYYAGPSRQLSSVQRVDGLADRRPLHQGGLGEVYRGWTVNGDCVAIKRYYSAAPVNVSRRTRGESLVQREANIGVDFTHPNVVRTHGYVLASELTKFPELWRVRSLQSIRDSHFIVMDWFGAGDLRRILSARSANVTSPLCIRELMAQLAAGLAHVHSRGVVHRDLHAAHAALTRELPASGGSDASGLAATSRGRCVLPGTVRIFDFGNSLRTVNEIPKRHTPRRLPLGFEPDGRDRSTRSLMEADRYALGLLWLELLLGRPCEAWRKVSARAAAVPHDFQCATVVDEALIAKAMPARTNEATRSLPALRHALQWPPPPLNGHKKGSPESSPLLERMQQALREHRPESHP